jgi:hypothetical protein
MKFLNIPVVIAVTLVLTFPSSAETLPSFVLRYLACQATHIVKADEGQEIDGVVRVIESWKGDLEKGVTITIPELLAFNNTESRTIDTTWLRNKDEFPRILSGLQMILFLKELPQRSIEADEIHSNNEGVKVQWAPASLAMQVSSAWIEDEQTFAYVQVRDSGPSILVPLASPTGTLMKEQEMKELVKNLIEECADEKMNSY